MKFPQLYYIREYMVSENFKASCLMREYLSFRTPSGEEGYDYHVQAVSNEWLDENIEFSLA